MSLPRTNAATPYASCLVALIALIALAAVAPLIFFGPSCGHDFTFHMQSWLDAGAQMRHGTLLPNWAASPAWNAGEPRFLFYPPLSWLLGALLQLVLPIRAVPVVFTVLALTLAGLGAYRLARDFASPALCLIAATVYLAGPYALFTAFERSAYGELLAAAWLPWLLRAALRKRLSIQGVAVPVALLWLTNIPAAVMGTYAFAAVLLVRLLWEFFGASSHRAATNDVPLTPASPARQSVRQMALNGASGAALGFALAAFYLLPAAYERSWVQVAMATIPNMRVEDNFLFGHTGDVAHDAVLHTASLIAVSLITATAVAFAAIWLRQRSNPSASSKATSTSAADQLATRHAVTSLAVLACTIAFLLTRPSIFLWHHLPELSFLQFPWRLLVVLSLLLSTALALAFAHVQLRLPVVLLVCVAFASAAGLAANQTYRLTCEMADRPSHLLKLFATSHGSPPTDEYTPADADNDELRTDDPPYWLSPDPQASAPGTRQSPSAITSDYDTPTPEQQTVSSHAPRQFHLQLEAPAVLILNLRSFPAWRVLRNGAPLTTVSRDDGLIAVRVPAGDSAIELRWQTTPDRAAGEVVSLVALPLLALCVYRSRKLQP